MVERLSDTDPPVWTDQDVARLYTEARREGVINISQEEFLALPPGIQIVTLRRAFGGDGGTGYDGPGATLDGRAKPEEETEVTHWVEGAGVYDDKGFYS